jgi:peroxiredoxin/uncharacterized membrane protein YphA (DoxX/SURF4 family)
MDVGLVVARLLLAVVFVIAGLAKLIDRSGSRQALIDFGIPVRFAPQLGILLPLGELVIALALLPMATARWGALAAFALVALFTAAILLALARGNAPACRCFGQISATPVGAHTVVRNVVLLGLSAFVLIWGNRGPSILAPLAALSLLSLTEWLTLSATLSILLLGGVLVLLLIQILRQQGRILLRLEEGIGPPKASPGAVPGVPPASASGLPVGAAAPRFRAQNLEGERVELDHLLALKKPVLLLFIHPQCGPCDALMPEVAAWQRVHDEVLTMPVVTDGTVEENRKKLDQHGLNTTLVLQRGTQISKQYHAYGTPSAVLVRVDGTIGSPVAGGADAIRRLLATVLTAARQGLRPGDRAPEWVLEDIEGRTFSLRDFQEAEILLMFWNPSCGFCRQMLEPLLKWEETAASSSRRLVIVTQSDASEMALAGFRSTVIIDRDARVTRAFGVNGTPMAVLLDERRRVASEIAMGADAFFRLAKHGASNGS